MSKPNKSEMPVAAATACSPSSDVPETLAAWKKFEKTSGIVAFLKHAIRMERERNQWRNEHDRVVREYQHRLMVIGTSVIDATSYPENADVLAPAGEQSPTTKTNE
jgi:hypothetical protein